MSFRIFSINQVHNLSLLCIFISSCMPLSVHSASCGLIPSGYPLYTDDKIKIDDDITINGNNVSDGEYSSNSAISANGSAHNVSQSLPDLDPSSFPANNSNVKLEITSSTTINVTAESYYKEIEIKKDGVSVNFSGGGPFHIEELKVDKKNVTLNFAAGTYYIDKLKIDEKSVTINVTSSPVIFHIGDEFKIDGKDAKINTSGNVDDFLVYLHSGAKFESEEKNLDFTGLIYGPDVDKVKIAGKDSTIHGAIIVAGGEIEIEDKNISFIYTSADQTAIGNISTCENPGGGSGGGDTAATNFNCVENGANGITGRLYTKTTAQSFNFDIVALKDSSTIETSFASGSDHTVTVELVDASTGNGSCANYSVLSPAVSQNLTFISSDAGINTSALMNSSTAYRSVKCRITDATDSPSVVGCSTDSFAIRPTTFIVSSNLTNTSSTGSPKAKAGEFFTLTATATKGYTGIPSIDPSKIEAYSEAINVGTVSGTFSAASFSAGSSTGTGFTYSEVGSLRFAPEGIYDDSFTNVDQSGDCTNNFSDTPIAGKVGCKFGNALSSNYFGRFTPDHFSLDTTSHTPACSTFSYMSQPINFGYTISARNASGAITQNYHGNYVNMSAINFVAEQSDIQNNESPKSYDLNNDSTGASKRLKSPYKNDSLIYDKTDWYEGQYLVSNSTTTFLRDTNLSLVDGPFDSLDIGVHISDEDGINFDTLDMQATVNNDSCTTNTPNDCTERKLISTKIRYGRAEFQNAYGSELADLPVSLTTQYWNGVSWIVNSSDQCSLVNLSLTDPDTTDTLTTTDACVWDSGSPGSSGIGCSTSGTIAKKFNEPLSELLPFTKKGDFNLHFKAPGIGKTGPLDVTATVDNHLKFNWKGTGDINPGSRITFGIFKGNDKQIYFREVY